MGAALCAAATASSAQSTQKSMQFTQYRNKQCHGGAAENANAMADRLKGKRVDQVGRDNSANGANRILRCRSRYLSIVQEINRRKPPSWTMDWFHPKGTNPP